MKLLIVGGVAGVYVINEGVVVQLGLSAELVERVIAKERIELKRRESLYRQFQASIHLAGKTVILVDDGLATGATMRAAIKSVRQQGANFVDSRRAVRYVQVARSGSRRCALPGRTREC